MDERLKFIARLLKGEKMAPVCRELGISRVTGYKIFKRYKEWGLDGLNDRAPRPYRQATKLPFQVELFGHLKRILKLDRLRLRGMTGASDEFLLAATAQNLRRLALWLSTGPPESRLSASVV